MRQDFLPESDFLLLRKFFAVQETISLKIAERTYSDSKLQAVLTSDPDTFSKWLSDAQAWKTQTRNAIQ